MNGVGTRKTSFSRQQPSPKVLLDGYKSSLDTIHVNGSKMNTNGQTNGFHVRSSDLLDRNDPVSMHLLMETAIGDSQHYGVLSFEEADELKKELEVLATRIEATKRKLAIENKLRDAASSLSRLNNPSSRESITENPGKPARRRSRRSILGRSGVSDLQTKADDELAVSSRKCEDLAQELWSLEKRSEEVQRRLLEHTARVLQMTHKGYLEKDLPPSDSGVVNGYSHGLHPDLFGAEFNFDDRSFYHTLDSLLETNDGRANDQISAAFEQQTQSILEIERKIWDLNRRLRDSIAQASAGRQMLPAPPAPDSSGQQQAETALQGQIGYLEKGLDTMQRSQVETLQGYKQIAYAAEERLEDLNTQLRGIIIRSSHDPNSEYPLPPDVSGRSPEEQIGFLAGGLDLIEQRVQQLKEESQGSTTKSLAHQEEVGQYERALGGLWENVNIGEGQRNQGSPAPREPFSLDAFSAKVMSLQTRVTGLHEEKEILGRQIQQQRELNTKSDIDKDGRLVGMTAELEQLRKDLELASEEHMHDSNSIKAQLTAAKEAKDQLLGELQDKHDIISGLESEAQSNMADSKALEQILEEKSIEADKARKEMESFEGEMVRLQTELTVAKAELDGAYGTRAQRAAEVASHPALQQELGDLNERHATLSEEFTTVKSKHEAATKENAELSQRVQILQKELTETIGEYEIMTKSSLEYEREREHLENDIDGLRDQCETLETQLSDEKVRLLGASNSGSLESKEPNGTVNGNTGTSILKNEFKKMMREMRSDHMRALRFEQNERRKLEAQLRLLNREQAHVKSSLNHSMTTT